MSKDGWEIKTLQDVCIMKITDGTHQTPTYCNKEDGGFPFISAKNVTKEVIDFDNIKYIIPKLHKELYKRVAPQKDDVLLAKNGTTGVAALVEDDRIFDIYVTLAVLRPNKKNIFPEYLLKVVNSPLCKVQFNAHLKGSGVPNLHLEEIQKVQIPLPPLAEQKRIVKILDEKFATFEQLKSNAQKNLDNAKELFQAELSKSFSNKNWEKKRLGDVCEIARGGSPRPISDYITNKPDGINWIKIGDTDPTGKYIYSTKEKIKPEGKTHSRYVKIGDFLLSNSMSFGRPYILKTDGCIHDGWLVLRNYHESLIVDFFYYLLLSPIVQQQFELEAKGSTVRNLNSDIVSNVKIPLPPLTEQEHIINHLDAVQSKVRSLQEIYTKTLSDCDELKQSFLSKAFNGEM